MTTLTHAHEVKMPYPERYPMNKDSLGIELVGKHLDGNTYDAVHRAQQESLTSICLTQERRRLDGYVL